MVQYIKNNVIYMIGGITGALLFAGLVTFVWQTLAANVDATVNGQTLQPGMTMSVLNDNWLDNTKLRYGGINQDGELIFYHGKQATTVVAKTGETFRGGDETLRINTFDVKTNIVTVERVDD